MKNINTHITAGKVPPAIQEDPTSLNNDEDSNNSIPNEEVPIRESFAEKLKYSSDLQVAIFCEPSRVFSEGDKLDFIDVLGEIIDKIPNDEYIPTFRNTIKRDRYIIITASDEKSKDWLFNIAPGIQIWEEASTLAIMAKDLPKIKRGLLWLPGRKKIDNLTSIKRLKRQNPNIKPDEWKVFSRHEEAHGIRLLIGINEEAESVLKELGNVLSWSTTIAQYTPIEDVIRRRKEVKAKGIGRQNKKPLTTADKRVPNTSESTTNLTTEADGTQPKTNIVEIHIDQAKDEEAKVEDNSQIDETMQTGSKAESLAEKEEELLPKTDSKRKAECNLSMELNENDQNPELLGIESPFQPKKSLLRSPKFIKPPKKAKEEISSGKITEYFRNEKKENPPAGDKGNSSKSTAAENRDLL